MTNEFKLTNCILVAMVVLMFCTYIALIQCMQNDMNSNVRNTIQTVAAFNA